MVGYKIAAFAKHSLKVPDKLSSALVDFEKKKPEESKLSKADRYISFLTSCKQAIFLWKYQL